MNLLDFIGKRVFICGQHNNSIYHCGGVLKLEKDCLVIREPDSYFCLNIQNIDDYSLNESYFSEVGCAYFYSNL